jgi:transmembrane sensor
MPEPHTSPPDWERVARYLADEVSDEEREQVRGWMGGHAGDAAMVEALDRSAERLGDVSTGPIDVEAALARVKSRIHDPVVTPIGDGAARQRFAGRALPAERRVGWRIAAAVVVVALGAWTWHLARTGTERGDQQLAVSSYDSGIGKRDTVRLADGTTVILAPRSHLEVSANDGKAEREVELKGEGFFDVVHDDARPFVIHAGGAVIRDVGTSFSVKARDEAPVRVAVSSGAVLLGSAAGATDSGVVLHSGDAGTVGAKGTVHAMRGGATDDDTAWKDGRLVFREAPLSVVAAEVQRWYGVELRIDSSVARGGGLTHTAVAGEPVENLLNIMAQTRGARWERRGDTVYMHSGR